MTIDREALEKAATIERIEAYSNWDPASGCRLWTAGLFAGGYGAITVGRKTRKAHVVAYELERGRVPAGLVLDHLCRRRNCINVAHLEPVTQRENIVRGIGPTAVNAAKTHCHKGHQLDATNTYMHRGKRNCRQCGREAGLKYYRRQRRAMFDASTEAGEEK